MASKDAMEIEPWFVCPRFFGFGRFVGVNSVRCVRLLL